MILQGEEGATYFFCLFSVMECSCLHHIITYSNGIPSCQSESPKSKNHILQSEVFFFGMGVFTGNLICSDDHWDS